MRKRVDPACWKLFHQKNLLCFSCVQRTLIHFSPKMHFSWLWTKIDTDFFIHSTNSQLLNKL
jgi:hypothetical protein